MDISPTEKIVFNRPYLTGKEMHYIYDAVNNNMQLSGNGKYTNKCQDYFESKFGIKKCLLTSSCTDALEMCSILIDTNDNDEIIIPSYTFVSSALPFIMKGAKIKFADSGKEHPNITLQEITKLTTPKTKAVVVVHYAGQALEIDKIAEYCKEKGILLIEDAAQAINVTFKNKYLGSYGDLATFSFHETKNIISGEGGLLAINNKNFINRAEIIWEKGTNRAEFFRGEVNKYGWVDVGSSFLPSELTAAFLFAQLEQMENILDKRKIIWDFYDANIDKNKLATLGIKTPVIPDFSSNNGHIYYLICNSIQQRQNLIAHLKDSGVHAVFHYLPLHKSDFYLKDHQYKELKHAEMYADCLVRLPLHLNLDQKNLEKVVDSIHSFVS